MKVLHICSDFAKQSIYDQFVTNLSIEGVSQEVYVPVRSKEEIGKYINNNLYNVKYHYSHILNKRDRLLYFSKISKIEKDLKNKVKIKDCDIIHAHFLFSDGGVAYKLNREYGIPYIVAVRNTDINIFFKYFIHLRKYAIEILKNASKIIFLSPKYKELLLEKYISKKLHFSFLKKTEVVPNGVNPHWLNNINVKQKTFDTNTNINFLYVGDFTKNKNIQFTIKILNELRLSKKIVHFTIVGGGGDFDKTINKMISENSEWITFHGKINDVEVLRNIYKESDIFIMPSKLETFGLVYIEAMSQGLPVIFTSGQAIDGLFVNGEIGYSVNFNDKKDCKNKIQQITINFDEISKNCSVNAKNFSWANISKKYIDLYTQICSQKLN